MRIPARRNGQVAKRPPKACPLQQYIILSQESEAYYPLLTKSASAAKGYTLLASTSPDADVQLSYANRKYDWLAPPLPFANKSKAAAAFISNCGAKNERLELLAAIQKAGFPVHSFGECLHNRKDPGDTPAAKASELRRHLFALAFENSNVAGYVTEKYFQCLAAGTVPVYLGAPNIAAFSPTRDPAQALLLANAPAGKSAPLLSVEARGAALAARLKALARDEVAYSALLAWKRRRVIEGPLQEVLQQSKVGSNCRVCLAVQRAITKGLKSAPSQSQRPTDKRRGIGGSMLLTTAVAGAGGGGVAEIDSRSRKRQQKSEHDLRLNS
jgi:hypothetical protein